MNVFERIEAKNKLLWELLNGTTSSERQAEIVELLYGHARETHEAPCNPGVRMERAAGNPSTLEAK